MSVDIKSICVGDYITIRVRAVEVDYGDPNRTIRVSHINSQGWVPNDDIVIHEPRALAVGDIVINRINISRVRWKIIAIVGKRAWIEIENTAASYDDVCQLSVLERAE